ncbi:MAG: hypothetical protein AAGG72_07390 [Pseudomonadota bacterium]
MTGLYANRTQPEFSTEGLKFRDNPNQAGSQVSLGKVARIWTLMWLVMQSVGARPTRKMTWDCSRPLHLSLEIGARYSTGDLMFNPNFSDWMMGWPIGWTAPEQPATAFVHWLQQMRGALSKLPIFER